MQIIGLILVGIVIGFLARLILPGKQKLGLLMTLLLGVVGAVIGGTLASYISSSSIFELNFIGFVAATVVAVVLLAVAEATGIAGLGKQDRVGRGH